MKKQHAFNTQNINKAPSINSGFDWVSAYDVIWNSHGHYPSDSMPLGDGDTGINIWTTAEDGLYLLLGRSDTLYHQKAGRLHLTFEPDIFKSCRSFEQHLYLQDGYITITADSTVIKIWADANVTEAETLSVLHIEGESSTPHKVFIKYELWRDDAEAEFEYIDMLNDKRDTVCDNDKEVLWFQRNSRKGCKNQLFVGGKLSGIGDNIPFGLSGKHTLASHTSICNFNLLITMFAENVERPTEWYAGLAEREKTYISTPKDVHFANHKLWWNSFWLRSHIVLSGFAAAFRISSQYALQRYIFACSSRGLLPSLFNGSIFRFDTPRDAISAFSWVAEEDFNADMRPWENAYMGQNTRHQFWPLITSGDYDLMEPLIRLVRGRLKEARTITWETMGHEGAFITEIFYEAGFSWEEADLKALHDEKRGIRKDDSPENKFWHLQYHFLPTIEFTVIFTELYLHTLDPKFLEEVLLPCADEFISFYQFHYPEKDVLGKRIIYPAGTAETYGKARSGYESLPQRQDVMNPVSETAGLRYLLDRLLSIDDILLGHERIKRWSEFLAELPEVPEKKICNQRLLAPGESYSPGLTCEANELYAVWPFRQYTFLSDNILLAIGRQSFYTRRMSLDGSANYQYWETGGWYPSSINAAVLGLPKEASRLLELNYDDVMPSISSIAGVEYKERPGMPRFSGFWNHPHMDGIPDQCHGGVCMNALQQMLIQWDMEKIYLLPAWPDHWDVEFKLYAPYNTMVECIYKTGKITSLKVTPASRKSDIIDCSRQEHRIRTLVQTACGDMNHMFNLPSMEDGIAHMDDFANRPIIKPWLDKYAESIIGVRGGPFDMQYWGGSVYKDNILYLHVLENISEIVLRSLAVGIVSAEVLTGGMVTYRAKAGQWLFDLSECIYEGHIIIKLITDTLLDKIAASRRYEESLTLDCSVAASSVMSPAFAAKNAVDGRSDTFWARCLDDDGCWFEVDMGSLKTINRAELHLKLDDVRYGIKTMFDVYIEDSEGKWIKMFSSQAFGEFWAQKFKSVTTRKVRISINIPGIRFFGLYND